METFSALLAICAGNSPVSGEFPTQRPVTRSFDIFFDLRLNKRLSKQSWSWWFETLACPLWRQCNVMHEKSVEVICAVIGSQMLSDEQQLCWEFIGKLCQALSQLIVNRVLTVHILSCLVLVDYLQATPWCITQMGECLIRASQARQVLMSRAQPWRLVVSPPPQYWQAVCSID